MPAALYSIQRLGTPFDNIADALPRAKEVIASTCFSISTRSRTLLSTWTNSIELAASPTFSA